MLLTSRQTQKIESCIAEVEKKTSGEIVVCAVKRSGAYAWTYWTWSAIGLLGGSAAAFFWEWNLELVRFVEYQLFGVAAGLLVSLLPVARRVLVSPRKRAFKVDRAAQATFLASGMAETQDRTGILIYVSEFEHRVEILADRGIHTRVESDYWERQVRRIVEGIRARKTAEALEAVIREVGGRLAELFPARDQKDELPNTVLRDPN